MRRFLVLSVVVLLGLASRANAQSEAVIGLGLAVSSHDPTGTLGVGTTGVGPLLRLKLGTGLGPAIGFDWHSVGAEAEVGNQRVFLGKVRIRPVMGGVAYNWNFKRYWLSTSLVGGHAFVGLTVNDRARPAFRNALDASYVTFDVSGSFVWRSQVALWYDAAPRVGLLASIAYLGSRPTLSVTSDRGSYSTHLSTASTVLTFGLVYGVF